MISTTSVETLCIYCQNVGWKHNWTINLLEQMKSKFDILFLQEPLWATVRYTTSLTEKDIPGTCQVLHQQSPYLGAGHVVPWEFSVWASSQAQKTPLPLVRAPYCYIRELLVDVPRGPHGGSLRLSPCYAATRLSLDYRII
jgi:hypothetical protein